MKIGIMQPYFMPYIGYWQLMNAVDKYVIYDDVNYRRGFINRNRILVNGHVKYIDLPLLKASQNKRINEIAVNNNKTLIIKNLRMIEESYKKAPQFEIIYPLVEKILYCGEETIERYIKKSFDVVCGYLDISTELVFSSDLDKDCKLRGQDKILAICTILNATEYYNAIGGQELYSFKDFSDKGIELKFLKTDTIRYRFRNAN